MIKQKWYIKIDGKQQGPFSLEELKKQKNLTPETLCCKEGDDKWKPISSFNELEEIFQDRLKGKESDDIIADGLSKEGELTIQAEQSPNPFLLYFLILILLLMYMLYYFR